MVKRNLFIRFFLFFIFLSAYIPTQAQSVTPLQSLQQAYPDNIQQVSANYITWKDGTRMLIRGSIPLFDHFASWFYHVDKSAGSISKEELLRDQYVSVFKKMYGGSVAEVKKNLVTIYWMPNVFGQLYPLRVTTVNGVDKKLQRISAELEKLPFSYYKYLCNPAGSFYWRKVAGQSYLSTHSFGIAIDINSNYANYWLWDLQRSGYPLSEFANRRLMHQNRVPMRIVEIFEKEGFLWGGRWYFYDTMHFEYRPEFFVG